MSQVAECRDMQISEWSFWTEGEFKAGTVDSPRTTQALCSNAQAS